MNTMTAAAIHDLIKAGRIVEAGALLTMHESELDCEERDELARQLLHLRSKAETLIAQAEALEAAGNNADAKALYQSVLLFAADFPDIQAHLKRTDEALLLAKAVRHRSQRLRATTPARLPSPAKKRSPLVLVLGAAAAAAIALLVLIAPQPGPEQHSAPARPPAPATLAGEQATPSAVPVISPPAEPQTPVLALEEQPPPAEPIAAEQAPAPASQPESEPEPGSQPEPQHQQPASEDNPLVSSAPQPPPVAPAQPAPAVSAPPVAASYIVQPGDSLILIARRQFCAPEAWKAIHQLNRDRIADPNLLQPGMELQVTGIRSRCPSPR